MRIHEQLIFLAVFAAIGGVAVAGYGILRAEGYLEPTPPVPSRGAMVGEWAHGGSSARLELFADGTLELTDVPRALLLDTEHGTDPHHGRWTDVVGVAGTWTTPIDDGEAEPVLDFSTGLTEVRAWIAGQSGSTRQIVFLYGDDLEYRYGFSRISTTPTAHPMPLPVPLVVGHG